jgi:hypothetical protein
MTIHVIKQKGTYMRKLIISSIIASVFGLMAPEMIQAQGTMTYLSNLGQPSAGSLAVGSNSWVAAGIHTGTNPGGYVLNSIQLGMTDASGNPRGFTAMLYYAFAGGPPSGPGRSLVTLDGSLNPVTGGIYTYAAPSNLTLSPSAVYFIVLTAGTAIANGAYEWSLSGINSYNPTDGWSNLGGVWTSSNGSLLSWNSTSSFSLFAVNATAVPEPCVSSLFVFLGFFLAWHRRKAKAVGAT